MKYRSKQIYGWLLMASMLLPILAACGAPANSGTGASSTPAETASAPAKSTAAASEAAASAEAALGGRAPKLPPRKQRRPPRARFPRSTLSGKVLRVQQITAPDVVDPQVELGYQRDRDPVARRTKA